MSKTKRGRPSKLMPHIQEKIVSALGRGDYIETAAALVGISKTTIYKWIKRGAREQERIEADKNVSFCSSELPFVYFVNAVERAQAEAEQRDLFLITIAAQSDWRAAAWRLERRFPCK